MTIDLDPTTHTVRVDQAGFDALRAGTDPDAALAVATAQLGPALAVVDDPLVTLTLTVTGAVVRLEHRGWVDRDTATLLVALRPGLFQVATMPPAFLTSALVRLTRIRPRRPDDDGPDFGWELAASWAGGSRHLVASDGRDGIRLVDPVDGKPRAATNTEVYRILSTLLPTP